MDKKIRIGYEKIVQIKNKWWWQYENWGEGD